MMDISSFRIKTFNHSFHGAFIFCIVLVCICIQIPTILMAQGNLLIIPKRIVFDSSKRIQDLNLANIGTDSTTYNISIIQIRMTENGTFENITTPDSGQYFANKNLRIFPRSVTLGPKESQTVKVQVTQVSDLPTGEYRSHIYFRAVPSVTSAEQKLTLPDSASLSVQLIPVYGISIPAIIQIGKNTSHADISDISIELSSSIPQLHMYINRFGNMSVYGDLHIDHISTQGKRTRVGIINGVAVYTPLERRKIIMKLELSKDIDYHSGKLDIQYVLPTSDKLLVLAQKEFLLHLEN